MVDSTADGTLPAGSLGVRARLLTYQASCRQQASGEAPQPPPRPRRATIAGTRPQDGRESRPGSGDSFSKHLGPRWALNNIGEQTVLKAGVLWLERELASGPAAAALLELPARGDGTPLVMQASFIRRLLRGELELKVCMEADVSAAQLDLRHLTTEQLLTIRARTLNFSTDSESHSSHRNFLLAVDNHLFEKLARRCLRSVAQGILPRRSEKLFALGVQLTLVIGAIQVLTRQAVEGDPPVPACWAIKLDERDWTGCSVALFHTHHFWLEVMPSNSPDLVSSAADGLVAVVCDRSAGVGLERKVYWEVTGMDPATDDILAELDRRDGASQVELSLELSAAIKQRCVNRLGVLGLEANSAADSAASPPRSARAVSESWTPETGKVASAVQRINHNTPPPPVRPAYLTTPRKSKPVDADVLSSGASICKDEAAYLATNSQEETARGKDETAAGTDENPEPEVARVLLLGQQPRAAPAEVPRKETANTAVGVDAKQTTTDESALPCFCRRTVDKSQGGFCAVPECFKGIF